MDGIADKKSKSNKKENERWFYQREGMGRIFRMVIKHRLTLSGYFYSILMCTGCPNLETITEFGRSAYLRRLQKLILESQCRHTSRTATKSILNPLVYDGWRHWPLEALWTDGIVGVSGGVLAGRFYISQVHRWPPWLGANHPSYYAPSLRCPNT